MRQMGGWQSEWEAPFPEGSQQRPFTPESQRRGNRVLGWWHRRTALPEAPAAAPFAERDRVRRSQLASTIILGFMVSELLILPVGFFDTATLYAILGALASSGLALLLNRAGRITAVGILLVVVTDMALLGATLGAPHGQLDAIYMPLFDLMVLSELIAVSILPPASVFAVALANSALVVLDVHFQPATPAFGAVLGTPDGYTWIIRPIVLQIVVALVAFLWVRSAVEAIQRADRAEEVAELERRDAQRKQELEDGARELLNVHVQLANGNFNVRTPLLRNPILWQVGNSLNNLIARFARIGQTEFAMQRTYEESGRLLDALRAMQSGRQPLWPAPTGTPVDDLVRFLQTWTAQGIASRQLPRGPLPPAALPSAGYAPRTEPSAAPTRPDAESGVPNWLFGQPAGEGGPAAPPSASDPWQMPPTTGPDEGDFPWPERGRDRPPRGG